MRLRNGAGQPGLKLPKNVKSALDLSCALPRLAFSLERRVWRTNVEEHTMNTLKPQSIPLRAPAARHSQPRLNPALPLTAALLAVLWMCAWSFELNRAATLAVSLVALVVGLMAHGIAVALAGRQTEHKRAPSARSHSNACSLLHDRFVCLLLCSNE